MRILTFLVCILGAFVIMVPGNLMGATFTVVNTADAGSGSLRDAINLANGNTGSDIIDFNIPGVGPHFIFIQSQLPPLIDPAGVIIDGLTQSGANPGANPPSTATLMVVINGMNAGGAYGLWILSSNNTIQGLVIDNFEQDGIRIQGTPDVTDGNYIYCNFIGMDQTGTVAQGNGSNQSTLWAGVNIIVTPELEGVAMDNTVEQNLISANYAEGVSISNCPPGDVAFNVVIENYIGTDINGTVDMGNSHDGVYIGEGAHDNAVDKNLISGNDFEGVAIVGYAEEEIFTYANIVINNIIGLDINLAPLGNSLDGVSIGQYGATWYKGGYAEDNTIDTNTIANNGGNGVTVWEHPSTSTNADFNLITRNSIYNNGLLGIDLADDGVTANDVGDPDTGPNEELNFPVIMSANCTAGNTTISGTIDIDTPPDNATIEVFKARLDPTNYGEGEIYLGSTNPDVIGNWVITVTGLSASDLVTATTTDMNNNTSEFCQNVAVIAVGIEELSSEKNSRYELKQNSPNPFREKTVIKLTVNGSQFTGKNCQQSTVNRQLQIYDVSGRLIYTFPSSLLFHHSSVTWDGRDQSGSRVTPGVYFYKLKTRDFTSTRKLILAE